MANAEVKKILRDLQIIPGIGPAMAQDLYDLGIRRVEDLRGRDPEDLYQQLCVRHGGPIDRCVLYVFRCAVYYSSNAHHEPEKLRWWWWKDTQGDR